MCPLSQRAHPGAECCIRFVFCNLIRQTMGMRGIVFFTKLTHTMAQKFPHWFTISRQWRRRYGPRGGGLRSYIRRHTEQIVRKFAKYSAFLGAKKSIAS